MKQQITFSVPGPPKAKERPRFKYGGKAYTSKPTRDYEKAVQTAALAALSKWRMENDGARWIVPGPFSLSVFFFFSDKRKRDLDNCLKSISDGIEKSPLIDNDHQLDEIYAFRDFDKRNPRAVVTLRRLREEVE